jgi:L-aminopeptidase/D-esterase-like protein
MRISSSDDDDPGTWKPSRASGRTVAGTSRRIWSRVLTIQASTTKVMTSGIQISSPVTKYFFIQRFRGASGSVARATAAAGSGGAFALGRLGLGAGAAAALEVGGVPAAALELEAGGRELLGVASAPQAGQVVSGASLIF